MALPSLVSKAQGRFEIKSLIGRGGFGTVHRALDTRSETLVALKQLNRFDASSLRRFKHEFRTLVDLDRRNLVSLYELFSDGDEWFFTMELVEGVPLLDYVRAQAVAALGPRDST